MPDNKPSLLEAKDSSQSTDAALALESLKKVVTSVYGDELWTAIKTGIAVIGSLSFKDLAHPITLLYEGGSGRGKSTIINILNPDRKETRKFVYRLDKFTPASFVSHAANVPKEEIKKIDLLPQLADKVLLVKELAPLFRGREDQLRENFGILTAVLDGKGYLSASGVHGTRGYEGRCVFNWLGATTPIPRRTDEIMAQLGNRILRYEIVGKEQSEDELVEFAGNFDPATEEDTCRKAANDVLVLHFASSPLGTVDPEAIEIPRPLLMGLVRLARLIAHGRVEVNQGPRGNGSSDAEDEFSSGLPEGPHRIILYLRTIAQGLALVNGRSQVSREDLDIIRHVAFSTITQTRREMLRAVLLVGGVLSATNAERMLGVSRPTARWRMKELAATGIVRWVAGNGNAGESIRLADKWAWLLPAEGSSEETEAETIPEVAEHKVPLWVH
jgi:hypothetical protein